LNEHFTYFLILGLSLAGPLVLSFDKKVRFYKKWKYLFPAMLMPATFYIVWDFYFTSKGIWSFNKNYVSGYNIYNLPVEEVLFFFVIPYCCVFIYECIDIYFPALKSKRWGDIILKSLGGVLFIIGILFYDHLYTSWTFIFTSIFIGVIYFGKNYFKFSASLFLISFLVMLIPFIIVNGFLTSIPVIKYNNAENLAIRISSIPVEDIFYGMLLILMNVILYEKLKSKKFKSH